MNHIAFPGIFLVVLLLFDLFECFFCAPIELQFDDIFDDIIEFLIHFQRDVDSTDACSSISMYSNPIAFSTAENAI